MNTSRHDGTNGFEPSHASEHAADGARALAASGAAPAREASLVDLWPMLRQVTLIVRRRWWFGLFIASVFLAVAFYFVGEVRTEFTAEATLVAQSPLDRVLKRSEGATWDPDRYENGLRNHLAVMTSRRFRDALVADIMPAEAQLLEGLYLEPGQTLSPDHLRSVLGRSLTVERERGREVYTVRVTHRDADAALWLANRFVEEYLAFAQGDLREADHAAKAALQREADALNAEIESLEAYQREFRQRHNLVTDSGAADVVADRMKSLNTALSDVRVRRAQAEVALRQAEADMARSPTPFNNPTLAQFGNNHELRAALEERKAGRAMLATRYGPNHPKMREADSGIADVQTALEENFRVALADLRAQLDLAVAAEKQIHNELSEVFGQAYEIDGRRAELKTVDGQITAKRHALGELLQRIAQVDISSELPTDVMRVVDRAFLRSPAISRRTVLTAFALLGGFALFVGAPLLLHALARRVSSTIDVEVTLGRELLGIVPRLGWMWRWSKPHVVRHNRRAIAVESFLGIASRLELRGPAGCPRRIVVSSTLPGEGKSVVASNLAAAFTRLGYRTLLIDCDFRRPVQQRFHRCEDESGLLGWIEAGCPELDDLEAQNSVLGVRTLPDGTFFLPAGGFDPEPGRHLLLPATARLFDRFVRSYDVTLIDTPPAGLFADAYFAARLADETALVVREEVPAIAQVRKVIADFERTSAPVAGLIFNDLRGATVHPSFRHRAAAAKYQHHYGSRRRRKVVRPPAPEPANRAR